MKITRDLLVAATKVETSLNKLLEKFDPSQPRDDDGRFATGGGSSGGSSGGGGLDSLEDFKNRDIICKNINAGNPTPSKSDITQIRKYLAHDFNKTPLYKQINTALRNNTKLSAAKQKVVDALDRVISDNPAQIDVVLYRSASLKHFNTDAEVGYKYKDKGFTSTSADWTIGADFQTLNSDKVMLKINVRKGTPALFVTKSFDTGPSEHEVILPRNAQFQLVAKKKYDLPHRGKREVWEFDVVTKENQENENE